MIIGMHAVIFSKKPEVDRAFFKKILKMPSVDTGDGWLIFGLPPAELAVHPSDRISVHELYLICDNIKAFVSKMEKQNIKCTMIQDRSWGLLTTLRLPGGGKLGVYEARHKRPNPKKPTT